MELCVHHPRGRGRPQTNPNKRAGVVLELSVRSDSFSVAGRTVNCREALERLSAGKAHQDFFCVRDLQHLQQTFTNTRREDSAC
jgi:hypothetical protein